MNEGGCRAVQASEGGQRIAEIAENEMPGIGDAPRVGRKLAVEGVERPPSGQAPAQMVEGPAVAEAELDHHAGNSANRRRGAIEAGALRGQPSDEAVEPGRRATAGHAEPSRLTA